MEILSKLRLHVVALLLNEHFVNALRCTVMIVIPVIVFSANGHTIPGIYTGLGVLLVSLTDLPAARQDRLIYLIIACFTLAFVTLTVTITLPYSYLVVLLIAAYCFWFPMFASYGGNLHTIGSLALIMMVFTIGLKPAGPFTLSVPILAGSMWYTLLTAIYTWFSPYRGMTNALGGCLTAIAAFLKCKANFYNENISLTSAYKEIIPGHLMVSEKQEAVRSILLKKHIVFKKKDAKSRTLIRIATDVVDLYEQILVTHYDYAYVRKTLKELHALEIVEKLIKATAYEIQKTGILIKAGDESKSIKLTEKVVDQLNELKLIRELTKGSEADLIEILCANFDEIFNKINQLNSFTIDKPLQKDEITDKDVLRFSSQVANGIAPLKQHFTFHSPIFRFALRLAITCVAAYLLILFVMPGKYSYWLLLTIVIIARPGFGATTRRNLQRISGSFVGIAATLCLLNVNLSSNSQFFIIAIFLAGYIGFLNVNYFISVIFITIVAILGLRFLGGDNEVLLIQRSYTVVLGGILVILTAFLFPNWETKRVKDLVKNALASNIELLDTLIELAKRRSVSVVEYKLQRKQVFVSTANLFKSFEHLKKEPNYGKLDLDLLYRFQILNHDLYSSTASLFHSQLLRDQNFDDIGFVNTLECSCNCLKASLEILNTAGPRAIDALHSPDIAQATCTDYPVNAQKQLIVIVKSANNIYEQAKMMAFL